MSSYFFSPPGAWTIVMVLMLIVEAAVPGLVSIWFAVGALAAMIAALCHASLLAQTIIFLLVSIAALIVSRPLAAKYVNSRRQPTNADVILGKECIVVKTIDNIAGTGEVISGGKHWTARSIDAQVILPEGTRAIVDHIEGVKAIVKPMEH